MKGLDYQLLHEFLWRETDRHGVLLLAQTDLAEKLGVTKQRANKIYSNLIKQHRMIREGTKYVVIDPEEWKWGNTDGPPPWKQPISDKLD